MFSPPTPRPFVVMARLGWNTSFNQIGPSGAY
jgi:hypothetical protein